MRGLAIALVKEYDQRYACAVRRHFDGRTGEGKQEKSQRKGTENFFNASYLFGGKVQAL